MTYGSALFLIAVGAILRFAVTATVSGVDIQDVGTILMLIGIVGLLLSLLYAFMWSRRTGTTTVVEQPVVRERRY